MNKLRKRYIRRKFLPTRELNYKFYGSETCNLCFLPISNDVAITLPLEFYQGFHLHNKMIHKRTCAKILIYAYYTDTDVLDLIIVTNEGRNFINERFFKYIPCDSYNCLVENFHNHLNIRYSIRLEEKQMNQTELSQYVLQNIKDSKTHRQY